MRHVAWGSVILLLSIGKLLEASSEAPSAHDGPDSVSLTGVSLCDSPRGLRGTRGTSVGTALGAVDLGVIAGSLHNAIVKLTTYQ